MQTPALYFATLILTPGEFHPILKNKNNTLFQIGLITKSTLEM